MFDDGGRAGTKHEGPVIASTRLWTGNATAIDLCGFRLLWNFCCPRGSRVFLLGSINFSCLPSFPWVYLVFLISGRASPPAQSVRGNWELVGVRRCLPINNEQGGTRYEFAQRDGYEKQGHNIYCKFAYLPMHVAEAEYLVNY